MSVSVGQLPAANYYMADLYVLAPFKERIVLKCIMPYIINKSDIMMHECSPGMKIQQELSPILPKGQHDAWMQAWRV